MSELNCGATPCGGVEYSSPRVEVVEFNVEQGFAGSNAMLDDFEEVEF